MDEKVLNENVRYLVLTENYSYLCDSFEAALDLFGLLTGELVDCSVYRVSKVDPFEGLLTEEKR